MTQIRCSRCGVTVTAVRTAPNKVRHSEDAVFYQTCHEVEKLLAAGGTWDNSMDCPNMNEADSSPS